MSSETRPSKPWSVNLLPFAGEPSKRKPPSVQYVPPLEKREAQVRTMNITGQLGKICEEAVTRRWNGELARVDDEKFNEARIRIVNKINDFWKGVSPSRRLLKNEHVEPLYTEIGGFGEDQMTEEMIPTTISSNPDFNTLITTIDKVTGTRLGQMYGSLCSSGIVDINVKHLIHAMLVISKELVNGERPVNGQIIRNVHLGKVILDAAIIPNDEKFNPETDKFIDLIKRGVPWSFIDLKVPFRERYASDRWKINGIFRWDRAQLKNQLVKLMIALEWNGKDKLFPWPEAAMVGYMRGVKRNLFFPMRINSNFITNWIFGIETMIDRGYVEQENVLEGIEILTRQRELLLNVENEEREPIPTLSGTQVGYSTGLLKDLITVVQNRVEKVRWSVFPREYVRQTKKWREEAEEKLKGGTIIKRRKGKKTSYVLVNQNTSEEIDLESLGGELSQRTDKEFLAWLKEWGSQEESP